MKPVRYTVEKCRRNGGYPRHYGYTIRRTPPHIQTTDDVEGIGLCTITPIVHHFQGWYKYKRDAIKMTGILNLARTSTGLNTEHCP